MEEDKNKKHPLDWNGKLVRFFFDNSRLVWLIIICILVGGAASLLSLRREGFPNVSLKTVAIQTIYPGANSKEVESKVTKEIESAVKDAKGIKDFSSISQSSFSQVSVDFDESVSIDQAVQDIQNKVSAAKSNLPKDVEQPKVMTWSTGGAAFIFGVSDNKSLDSTRTEAQKLSNEIETVPGVKKASLDEINDNIVISVDGSKLSQKNIALATINQLLQANNVDYPAGYLEIDGKKQSAITLGSLKTISDIEDIIIGYNAALRAPIYLKDVAKVSTQRESTETISRFGHLVDGKIVSVPGLQIQVSLTSTADIIKTKELILKKTDEAKKDGIIVKDLSVIPLYDQAKDTKNQVDEILSASFGAKKNLFLLGGLQLLFLAMLLLVNWRAALVSALSIPLSFGVTFIYLALTGTQLNTIVLFALVLVLGLIVDPAIVMIESIQRYRDLKLTNREAVIESGRRYGASLFMAVLTSLLVFIPFGVVSGYFGQIIKYLPLTVIPALVASYFVPMALLPFLSNKLLHKDKTDRDAVKFGEDENLSKPSLFVMKANRWILDKTWRKIMIIVVTLIMIISSISLVATGKIEIVQFAKPADNVMLTAQATYKKGLSFADKDKTAKEFEALLTRESGTKEYFFAQQTSDGFWMYINLKDKSERNNTNDKSKEIVKRIKTGAAQITNFDDIVVDEISAGPPTGSYQINTQLASNDLDKLEVAAKEVGKFLSGTEHVIKVDDGFTGKTDPEVQIILNKDKVQAAGLSSFEVGTQLKALIDKSNVGKISDLSGQTLDINLVVDGKPENIESIKNLPLISRDNKTFKVSDLSDVISGEGVSTIERYNGLRFATIQARVDDTKNTMVVQKKFDEYLTDAKLKELGIDSKLNKGDVGDISKSFTELGIALVVAIVLTYIVLVLQFKSFSLPGIMLFTIPLSLIGVFPMLWIVKSQFGFLELLGITILVGIVENVAIFLIDYANQLVREKGLTPKEAIIQSAGVRFRPILLTKLVALGGLLPLAIESEFWRGLSLVIIAGIGLSGFFSLIVIPILYVGIMNLRKKIHKDFI